MLFQNIFHKIPQLSEIEIDRNSLESVRNCLVTTGFELLEIRDFWDGRCDETWISPANDNKIRIKTVLPEGGTELEEDATRTELVDEVVDLWVELRAIRNLLSDDLDELLIKEEETPMERFFNKITDYREEREDSPDAWRFMFAPDVDESICAFNELEESDRLAIIH